VMKATLPWTRPMRSPPWPLHGRQQLSNNEHSKSE
jgi:hypothetical protein